MTRPSQAQNTARLDPKQRDAALAAMRTHLAHATAALRQSVSR
jgi:hypothetical protein